MIIEAKMIDRSMDNIKNLDLESQRQEILIKHQPDPNEPSDRRIVNLIKEKLISTDWAKNVFIQMREALIRYYKYGINNLDGSEDIHTRTQRLLSEISALGGSKIIEGEECLEKLDQGAPVLVIANHLGAYKLANVNPEEDLGVKIEAGSAKLENMHALPLFYGDIKPLADKLGDSLYIAAYEFPDPIGRIQKAADGVIIALKEEEELLGGDRGISYLTGKTKDFFARRRNAVLVTFPEGGTSGKRSGRGPYDLESFRKGVFVIASQVDVPILPTVQYFDPVKGFELKIFEPFILDKNKPKEYYENVAEATRKNMQAWLDQRKQSVGTPLNS